MIAANDPSARTSTTEPAADPDLGQPSPNATPTGASERLVDELNRLIDDLADADDAPRLGPRIKGLLRAIDRLDAVVAANVRRFDQGCEYSLTRHRSTIGWLKGSAGLAGVDAARIVRQARQSAAMPVFGPLWLAGMINTRKLDMTTIARKHAKADESFAEHEARFAATAVRERPEVLQSELAQWRDAIEAARHDPTSGDGEVWDTSALHLSEVLDGVGVIDGKLTAEAFAIVQRAIANEYERAHVADDPRSPAEQRADALVAICRRALEHTGRGHHRPHLLIHVDLETYLGAAVGLCETDRGTRLPARVLERIACDATLQLLIRDQQGVVLDLGRSVRRFSDDQRRALLAQYPTCAGPNCTIPSSDCEMHHIAWWTRNGPTDLANGAPLCWHHHDLVHRGQLCLRGEPDGSVTSLDSHGTILGVTQPRRPIEPIAIPDLDPDPPPAPNRTRHPRSESNPTEPNRAHWRPITRPIRGAIPHRRRTRTSPPDDTHPTGARARPGDAPTGNDDLVWPAHNLTLQLVNY
jgi:hypothetical protein